MILYPGTMLQDRYEILEKIGSGGMSEVYKAKCHKLNRLVAIKVLKEEFSTDAGFVKKFKLERRRPQVFPIRISSAYTTLWTRAAFTISSWS